MMLDIIKDYFKIKNKLLFIAKLVFSILILFGGKISFWLFIFALSMSSMVVSHSHIDFLVPITDKERKIRDIVKIFMINIEYTIFFIVGTLLSGKIYGYSDVVKDNFTFILMCTMLMFVYSVQFGLMLEDNRLSGAIKKTIKCQVKEDVYGNFVGAIGIVLVFVMAFFLSGLFFTKQKFSFMTGREGIIIFSIIMCVYIIEIIRKVRSIKVGDYHEIL